MLFLSFFLFLPYLAQSCTLSTGVVKEDPTSGDLCAECSYQGYLAGDECVCILPDFDPSNACLPVVPSAYENVTDYNTSVSECSCYLSWEDGYFTLSTPPKKVIDGEEQFVYGELEFPPICDDCYNEYYGPNPREMTASRLVLGGVKPCTQYGGPDPNVAPTPSPVNSRLLGDGGRDLRLADGEYRAWRACNNHGYWNTTWRGCQCDTGWGLEYIGQGYNGEVFSCNRCVGPWGPPTPPYQDAIENIPFGVFCSVPWTPDPDDGVLKECSGHGVYQAGECVCEGNWALGVYNLTQATILLEGEEGYGEEDVLYQVQTCITCKDGYKVEESCGTFRTRSPTRDPTKNPTKLPTKDPTKNPTKNPSRNPTINPTRDPSKNPTVNPTRNPSKNPTINPTRNPSRNPTINPTRIPTLNPSKNPTVNPSKNPTVNPTSNPTLNPTINPTLHPTLNPTLNPTQDPTVNPTLNPTENPTVNPTLNPTENPTVNPTLNPTLQPTRDPTLQPTYSPTLQPSAHPTLNPTLDPTHDPTVNPTLNPTLQPSAHPTLNPTTNPTLDPTVNPTLNPTLNPTRNPTLNPTLDPTRNPTLKPTLNPSRNPTKNPTRNPTKKPTLNPTENPTLNPTLNPTEFVGSIIFYDRGFPVNGFRGSRATSTSTCAARASVLGLDCIFTPMVLSYSYSAVSDFPSLYYFPPTVPIFSNSGVRIANSWDEAFTGGGLVRSLQTAGVFPPTTTDYFIGPIGSPGSFDTCNDWTSSSGGQYGVTGLTSTTAQPDWYFYSSIACDQSQGALCMCTTSEVLTESPSKAPTKNPSKAPTKNPTKKPTSDPTKNPTKKPTSDPTKNPTKKPTSDPTKNPTRKPTSNPTKNPTRNPTQFVGSIKFYSSGASSDGLIGDRATTTSVCAARAGVLGLTCLFTPMFLSYTTSPLSDFPSVYAFPPTVPLYSSTNTKVAVSWTAAVDGPTGLIQSLESAGVFPPSTGTYFTGTYTPLGLGDTCNDWTTNSALIGGNCGLTTTTSYRQWFNNGNTKCSFILARMCMCVSSEVVTDSPTKNPTKNPTLNPTRNPTKKPTSDPTKNPTKKPTSDPTKNPTRNPTRNPTKKPTSDPTKHPTKNPTKKPTSNPTANPTLYQCLKPVTSANCVVSVECGCGANCFN